MNKYKFESELNELVEEEPKEETLREEPDRREGRYLHESTHRKQILRGNFRKDRQLG